MRFCQEIIDNLERQMPISGSYDYELYESALYTMDWYKRNLANTERRIRKQKQKLLSRETALGLLQ